MSLMNAVQYARYRKDRGLVGGTPTAVYKAVHAKRLTTNADGLLDPAVADIEWEANKSPMSVHHGFARARAAAVQQSQEQKITRNVGGRPKKNPDPVVVESADGDEDLAPVPLASRKEAETIAQLQASKIREARDKIALENAQTRGELLIKSVAVQAAAEFASTLQQHWLGFTRYSAEMAAALQVEEPLVFQVLDRLVKKHLGDVSKQLEEMAKKAEAVEAQAA